MNASQEQGNMRKVNGTEAYDVIIVKDHRDKALHQVGKPHHRIKPRLRLYSLTQETVAVMAHSCRNHHMPTGKAHRIVPTRRLPDMHSRASEQDQEMLMETQICLNRLQVSRSSAEWIKARVWVTRSHCIRNLRTSHVSTQALVTVKRLCT